MTNNTEQIDVAEIESQVVLAVDQIKALGCSGSNCEDDPTHVALMAITLRNGRRISCVRHFCKLCALAVMHRSGIEA